MCSAGRVWMMLSADLKAGIWNSIRHHYEVKFKLSPVRDALSPRQSALWLSATALNNVLF